MLRSFPAFSAAALVCLLAATPACAHAFLDHATPAVGSTVSGSPGELRLSFTENVVAPFSNVHVTAEGGGPVPAAKPRLGAPNELIIRLGHPLKPGTYVVSWHVVSVDTHPTQGTYKFTITR
ncbi:MAG TPA: copper homeostasis periplasmic binding protein CopC [Methylovirgula sp.]|nr:copper homeostasis periplasmic binding protein CopC [Methylovirgula sp.]